MDRLPPISKSFNSFSIAVNSSISHFFLTHSENCVSIFLIVDSSRRAIVSNQNFFPNSNLPSRLLLPLSICTQLQRTPGHQSSLVAGCCWIWRNSGWQKTRRLRLDPSGNWWCFVGYCCRRGLQKLKEELLVKFHSIPIKSQLPDVSLQVIHQELDHLEVLLFDGQ